ncbi:sugar O-acyltransferase, sialic acid O-acetyltransferase NeuD family [Dokdonia sp. MED134]|uniref:acetyltransferase n=1 Tax=Dokdonia sp. MED134 TaxID=313590 RepID=UPI000068AB70|nr:acetyltransferase [Dokdonia sp. MED134]EAQ40273.1 sugar O-acyltransferase, sialic acid O-acetyltransferase NeuD family [Dokdonia sp. MED134]
MVIYGASGHGKAIKAIADSLNIIVDGFIDDNYEKESFLNVPVRELGTSDEIIIGIGNNNIRKKIAESHTHKWHNALIHKSAIVSVENDIGSGTVIMPGVVINECNFIGEHCIINSASVIEHDCIINDYAHISPNATLSGGVNVGVGAHIGAGASVIPGITIGKWSVVGAGAVVIRDIPDFTVVVGNPARIIKTLAID